MNPEVSRPDGWSTGFIKNVADYFVDGDWIETPFIEESGIRLIQTGNIGIGSFLDKPGNQRFISRRTYGALRCHPVEMDDILICRLADPVGRACQVPAYVGPAITSVDCTIFRPNRAIVNPRFALHWFASPRHLQSASDKSGGSTRKRISRRNLGNLPIPLPPLEEQREIAQTLDAMADCIDSSERLIAKLALAKQGLLHDLLTRGIDESGRLRHPSEGTPVLVPHDSGFRPSIWRQLSFGELAKYVNGNSFDVESWTDTGYPIIRIQNLNGSANFNFYNGPVAPGWLVQPGDLLFAWSGTRESSFGPTIWSGPQGVLNQHIFKVYENKSVVSRQFLYLLLNHNLERIAVSAHGFKDSFVHVRRDELTSIKVNVPSMQEQERILCATDSLDHLIEVESLKLRRLRLLWAGLMDDLLTGRVRVGS